MKAAGSVTKNQGVQALFNADLYAGDPLYAPREDWIVISEDQIAHEPQRYPSDESQERSYEAFFKIGWLDPKYDSIRERWDRLLNDEDPHARVLAKVALWSVVMHREAQEMVKLLRSR